MRVERPHAAYFRYAGPGQLVAREAASAPRTPAGRALAREYALRSLVRLAHPALPELLANLVKDRSPTVRHAAVVAAARHGDSRLLAALRHITHAASTPAGTRACAATAIQTISSRTA